ncbi:MAG: hypothetical protein HPY45_13750 [Anaerolineae bacterium]|nr:hypothetical protein [Anaerolineae bacterium]
MAFSHRANGHTPSGGWLSAASARRMFAALLLIGAVEALGCLYLLLSIPADAKHATLFGYSPARLALAGVLVLFCGAAAAGAWQVQRRGGAQAARWLMTLAERHLAAGALFTLFSLAAWGLAWISLHGQQLPFLHLAAYHARLRPLFIWLALMCAQCALALLVLDGMRHRTLGTGMFGDRALLFGWLPPLFVAAFAVSSAQPILYPMALALYAALALTLRRALPRRALTACLFLFSAGMGFARLFPLSVNLNDQDLTVCAVMPFAPDETLEQDFWLDPSDWRLERLMARDDTEVLLRLLGDYGDPQQVSIFINGRRMGSLASLLYTRTETPFYGYPVYNHYLRIPKDALQGAERITLRIQSSAGFHQAYSSGIHPLPQTAHSRLIAADGTAVDLAQRYFHRRFRFQNVWYIISTRYRTERGSPLVLGVIQ